MIGYRNPSTLNDQMAPVKTGKNYDLVPQKRFNNRVKKHRIGYRNPSRPIAYIILAKHREISQFYHESLVNKF